LTGIKASPQSYYLVAKAFSYYSITNEEKEYWICYYLHKLGRKHFIIVCDDAGILRSNPKEEISGSS